MSETRYAIRCTPGGLLRDDDSGALITFNSYQAAEAEALRLTRQAYTNRRVAGFDFTPVLVDSAEQIISKGKS
jgi:hypothetical protein